MNNGTTWFEERADASKVYVLKEQNDLNIAKGKSVFYYNLKELPIYNATNRKQNNIIYFCGNIIDMDIWLPSWKPPFSIPNEKFPPFTINESDINKWVNYVGKNGVYKWDTDMGLPENSNKIIKRIEDLFSKQ